MSRSRLVGKIVFCMLGICALNWALYGLPILAQTEAVAGEGMGYAAKMQQAGIVAVFLAFAYVWLVKSDWIIRKMIGPQEPSERKMERVWIVGCLRAAAVFCGLAILFQSILSITWHRGTIIKPATIPNAIRVALGIYLAIGAPQYVQWLIRKSEYKNADGREVQNE